MITIEEPITEAGVLRVIYTWLDALCKEDYQAALEMLCNDLDSWTPDSLRVQWTPLDLKEMVENYGSSDPWPDGKKFRVSPLAETFGGHPTHDVCLELSTELTNAQPDLVGEVWYDMPLDGEWSDLTATFALRRRKVGVVLELIDMHVM